METLYCFSALAAGPSVTAPEVLNVLPWLGHTNWLDEELKLMEVPSCVQAT